MKRIVAGFITILTVASGLLWSLGYLEFVIPRTGVNCWGIGWRGQKIAAIIVPANDDGYLIFAVPGFKRVYHPPRSGYDPGDISWENYYGN